MNSKTKVGGSFLMHAIRRLTSSRGSQLRSTLLYTHLSQSYGLDYPASYPCPPKSSAKPRPGETPRSHEVDQFSEVHSF
jgi:hypothetical protein